MLFPTEAVDEYAFSALPELEGNKLQDITREGSSIDGGATPPSLLAFLLATPLAGEDGPTRAEHQEDRLLVILGQPFASP